MYHYTLLYLIFIFVDTGSHSLTGLELMAILLPQTCECWGYRHEPPCLNFDPTLKSVKSTKTVSIIVMRIEDTKKIFETVFLCVTLVFLA